MLEGGLGVISAAQPGYREADFYQNTIEANLRALEKEIAKARAISQGKGLLGINVMVAAEDYDRYVKAISHMEPRMPRRASQTLPQATPMLREANPSVAKAHELARYVMSALSPSDMAMWTTSAPIRLWVAAPNRSSGRCHHDRLHQTVCGLAPDARGCSS